jgi:hypothetical protein
MARGRVPRPASSSLVSPPDDLGLGSSAFDEIERLEVAFRLLDRNRDIEMISSSRPSDRDRPCHLLLSLPRLCEKRRCHRVERGNGVVRRQVE